MALEIQTIIDIILVTLAYCVSVLVVPNIVFHEMLHKKSLTHRFIVCTVLGNVYLVNIVFLIFLLHLPCREHVYDHSAFFPLDADQPSGNPTFLSDPFYEYLTFFSG